MATEFEVENEIFTAFTDQLKKDDELKIALKNTKRTIHVICTEADLKLAEKLKSVLEEMAGRGKDQPKLCSEDSAIMDVLLPGPEAIDVGGSLRRTEEIYIFISPHRSEKLSREQEQLLKYAKGAFSNDRTSHATMIAICPTSDRVTFASSIYDNELKFLDSRDGNKEVLSILKDGLVK